MRFFFSRKNRIIISSIQISNQIISLSNFESCYGYNLQFYTFLFICILHCKYLIGQLSLSSDKATIKQIQLL